MEFGTTPLEYLKMSELAYQDSGWENSDQYRQLSARSWRMHPPPRTKNLLRQGKGGYRGIVFINEKVKEVVCAHRGTASLSAVEADITLLVEQKVHAQVVEAIQLCLDSVVKNLLENNYSLTFTGHSLGGFLATANLYFCQRTDLLTSMGGNLHYPDSQAVVFDPAGSQAFLMTLEPYAISHAGLGEEGIRNLNILHFVSLPNYVNAYASHSGGTIYGLFPAHINLKNICPVTYLKQTHSLENLRQCFIELDSTSIDAGYPRTNQCRKMNDWPLIDLKELASLGTVFGAVSTPLKLGIDTLQALANIAGYHPRRIPFLDRLRGGEEYRQALALAMNAAKNGGVIALPELLDTLSSHYVSQMSSYNTHLHKLHFGEKIEKFLVDYAEHLQNTSEALLFSDYFNLTKSDSKLLENYRINSGGEISLVSSKLSIFDFRHQVAKLFLEKPFVSNCASDWLKNKTEKRIAALEQHFLNSPTNSMMQFSDRYKKAQSPQKKSQDKKLVL